MIGTKIPDSIKDYFDYEVYGRNMSIDEGGVFTEYGYVRDTYACFDEKYDGETEHILYVLSCLNAEFLCR